MLDASPNNEKSPATTEATSPAAATEKVDAPPALTSSAASEKAALAEESRVVNVSSAATPAPANTGDVATRLRRRLDIRLLPWAALAYVVNGLDRNNLSNAYVLGMDKELHLDRDGGRALPDANLAFFVTYVTFQLIMNSIIPRVRPHLFLPTLVVAWGSVAAFMSLCQNDVHLYILRALLGICEAGFYPGIIYLLGTWYPKEELGLRITIFSVGGYAGSALSGFLAGIMALINGAGTWRSLFVVEGVISIVVALPGFWLIPDYPNNTKWIPDEERELAIRRMEEKGSQIQYTGYSMAIIKNLFFNPIFYIFIITMPIANMIVAILSYFVLMLSTTADGTVNMGYDKISAQFITIPIYVVAAIIVPFIGKNSDRTGDRYWHSMCCLAVAVVVHLMLMINDFLPPNWLVFVLLFILTGTQALYPLLMSWVSEMWSVDNQTRAFAIAIFNASGNLVNNFIPRYIWLPADAARYRLGKTTVAILLTCIMGTISLVYFLQKRDMFMPVNKDGKTVRQLREEYEAREIDATVTDEKKTLQQV